MLSRPQAVRLVDETRDELIAATGTTDSWCDLGAGLLAARLVGTPDAWLHIGEVGDGHHWWVTVGGLRLDPTADQFDFYQYSSRPGLPAVCKDRYRRRTYWTRRRTPINEQTVRAHLEDLADLDGELPPRVALAARCRHHAPYRDHLTALTRAASAARKALARLDARGTDDPATDSPQRREH